MAVETRFFHPHTEMVESVEVSGWVGEVLPDHRGRGAEPKFHLRVEAG